MIKPFVHILILFTLLIHLGCTKSDIPTYLSYSGQVSGRILLPETISTASISTTLTQLNGTSETTLYQETLSQSGHYSFSYVPEGQFKVSASYSHSSTTYNVQSSLFSISKDQSLSLEDLTLTQIIIPPDTRVQGVISSSASSPLEDVFIQLLSNQSIVASVTTNAMGAYQFDNIATGNYTIRANKIGYVIESSPAFSIEEGAPIPINMTLDPVIGHLEGHVYVLALGQTKPLKGVAITLETDPSQITQSDDNGSFLFTNIPPGVYLITISYPSLATINTSVTIKESQMTNAAYTLEPS